MNIPNQEKLESSLSTHILIPTNIEPEEIDTLITHEANCNEALRKWLMGEISEEDYFDILEENGHHMDDYLDVLDFNLWTNFEI